MENKLKIVISTYTFIPDIGGVATNRWHMAEALLKKGCEVSVVTLSEGGDFSDEEFEFEVIRNPNPIKLVAIYMKADVVLFSNLSLRLSWPALFLKKGVGLSHHSSSAFEGFSDKKVSRLRSFFDNIVNEKSIHFVNSEFTRKNAGKFFEDKRVCVTYPISKVEEIPLAIKREFENKADAIFVGRVESEKGVSFLVDNFEVIKKELGINNLHILGVGGEYEALRNRNVDGIVFHGAVDRNEVSRLLNASAFAFVPSIWEEPFGNVAVEGLAAGAVVISSNRGGLPEAAGSCSVLFGFEEGGFVNALRSAKKIRKECVDDLDARYEYFSSVDEHLKKFSAEVIAKKVIDCYE